MAYTKTTWINGSSPPINATNLNKIEDGIFNNDAAITTASGTVSTLTTNFNNHVLESSHAGGRFYAYNSIGGAL